MKVKLKPNIIKFYLDEGPELYQRPKGNTVEDEKKIDNMLYTMLLAAIADIEFTVVRCNWPNTELENYRICYKDLFEGNIEPKYLRFL